MLGCSAETGRFRMLLLVTLACAPQPGEPGYSDCDPMPVTDDCLVWRCFEVQDDGSVLLWYAYGAEDEEGFNCQGYDCDAAFQKAAEEACGVDPFEV
jgi:hypothetical protein